MRKLKVKALYNIIPEKLTINVSHLGLGKTVKVGELSYEGLELLNAKEAVVCAVKLTRAGKRCSCCSRKIISVIPLTKISFKTQINADFTICVNLRSLI